MPDPKLRRQAALYSLEALTPDQKTRFEKHLATDPELQKLVDQLRQTLELTRQAQPGHLPEWVLEGQRNLLRGKIDMLEKQKQRFRPWDYVFQTGIDLWERIALARQPVWAVATYVLIAFLAGRLVVTQPVRLEPVPGTTPVPDILQMLENGIISSSDIDMQKVTAQNVSFDLKAKQEYNVSGKLNDQIVQQILYYLLLNDNNPGKRLKAVGLLAETQPLETKRAVLISALLTDPNAGVRLKAIKALHNFEADENLANACVKVLLEDENEAVRMAALGILAKHPTDEILPALQIVGQLDKNEFIRDQALQIVATYPGQVSLENTGEPQ